MIQEVEVQEDKDLWPYFTDKDMTDDYITCFASFIAIEYEVDEQREIVLVDDSPVELYTEQERARQFVTKTLDKIYGKWQKRQAANSVTLKSGGIS